MGSINGLKIFFFIFLFLILSSNLVYSQKDFVYFSFNKAGNKYLIGIEKNLVSYRGMLHELNYEWVLFFDKQELTYKTYKPFLFVENPNKLISGKVRIYSNDFSFDKEYNFVFKQRGLPTVSIVRYIEDIKVILPIAKIEGKEKLFPLIFNFSSNNLSIVWHVLEKFYYSLLFDPEGLTNGTEVKVIVTNIDNPVEFNSDTIKIEK